MLASKADFPLPRPAPTVPSFPDSAPRRVTTMAIDAPAPKSPEVAGKEFATQINDAVHRNDSKLYADTMAGINDWTKNNGTDKSQKFEESLIGNVDLKTAALYETKENFDRIDTIGKKDDRVKPDELQAYAKSSDTNALQKAMIEKQILPQYLDIANNSSDRFLSFMNDSHIRKVDLDKGLETAAANRPEEKLTEEQVAEKVKTPGFTAEAIDYAKDNFSAIDTSKNDKLDKKELETFAKDGSRSPMQKAYINQGILPKFDELANASKDNKLSGFGVADSEIRKVDLDKSLATEYAKPEVQAAVKELVPNSKLTELATVRKGEGPFHSAERILAAAGGKHGIDEVRALTKALKTIYNDEGHGDLKDLKVKHNFVTEKNFNKLIESVNNDKVREALKKMAAA